MSRKKEIICLTAEFFGAMICLSGVVLFNQYILMTLPLVLRMILMIVLYWLITAVPFAVMAHDKEHLSDYGFSKEHLLRQIIIGIVSGLAMSLIFTLIPHFAGFGGYIDSGKRYTMLWQFIYEFVYCITAVGFSEELVFRGFFYERSKRIFGTDKAAVICSSVLFGLFHIFSGSVFQMIGTGILGVLFCLSRLKIKDCSIISLIIMHGVYDALITVWASLLL